MLYSRRPSFFSKAREEKWQQLLQFQQNDSNLTGIELHQLKIGDEGCKWIGKSSIIKQSILF